MPKIAEYALPQGLIKRNAKGEYCISINSKKLKLLKEKPETEKKGIPESFYIKGENIILYPTPNEKSIITIDYITLAIGENQKNEEIFVLSEDTDTITVPQHLEELLKNAVIARAMLNSIASETDENFSAYKKQSETAYRMLIKYSKGVGEEKSVKI